MSGPQAERIACLTQPENSMILCFQLITVCFLKSLSRFFVHLFIYHSLSFSLMFSVSRNTPSRVLSASLVVETVWVKLKTSESRLTWTPSCSNCATSELLKLESTLVLHTSAIVSALTPIRQGDGGYLRRLTVSWDQGAGTLTTLALSRWALILSFR
jgi:hypothetical protein